MHGIKLDWVMEPRPRVFYMDDYEGGLPRWCPGCGDHAVLGAVQRLARDEQLPPEKTVMVSGIGCSSRFPHYMATYGFHGLHGRALPVACGVRSRRPDLHVFVATGDGDCCAIGAGHWIHAIRYNMKMVVMMFDNNIYGLTKAQTSPTTPLGILSKTHPRGAVLPPLDPLVTTLSVTNASFVAQTVDWNPMHLYATLQAAHRHPGFAFIRIIQRCPHFMDKHFDDLQKDPSHITMLTHANGLQVDDALKRLFKNQQDHDPSDLNAAFAMASNHETTPIGLLYQNTAATRYDEISSAGINMGSEDRLAALNKEMDRYLV